MSKHTPGKWQIGLAGGCNIVSYDGYDIIGVAKVPYPHNQHIIAAAPDLLEACKTALTESIGQPSRRISVEGLDIIRAAIAKAEGREP